MTAASESLAEAARRLNSRFRAAGGDLRLPPALFLTDAARLPDPLPAIARLAAGTGVVLRHYEAPDRTELAARLAALCRARGLPLIIAGDPGLAAALEAAGVHFPEALVARARRLAPRARFLVTAAAHSEAALRRAADAGADAALLSPVFPTASHPGVRALGPVRFSRLARTSPIPVYALGGVTARNARRLWASGAAGIAAISGFLN